MALIVQKYGGTSVGNPERIKNVARRVAKSHAQGNQMVIVLSAMSGETNRLIALAKEISPNPKPRELDVVISTGEQVTIGLLCMALEDMGVKARSYTGGQVRILTDDAFTKARILDIDGDNIRRDLDAGAVVVVAGFQGVDEAGNITTLGRGGSDTTGVALAAAIKADECQIYTDVDGVYTTDPRIVPAARKLNKITYEEMLEMASLGAKVLQTRSVEMAMKHRVRVQVLSSFTDQPGTLVCDEEEIVEQELVSGVAYSRDEAKVTLLGVQDQPGIAAAGRTDAGVHATAQVAHCDLNKDWEPFRLAEALNWHLKPSPVSVLVAARVPDDFHARFSAIERRYLFRLLSRRAPATARRDGAASIFPIPAHNGGCNRPRGRIFAPDS